MTPQSESEAVDFKPFFDMVVGILFILLIFIAAQLFFTQWGDPLAQSAARDRSRLISQWQQQATGLLEDIKERLRRAGFSAEVNLVDRSVTLPLAELVGVSPAGAITIEKRGEAIGTTLADRLGCIPGEGTKPAADCPPAGLLRLAGIRSEISVGNVPAGVSLSPERYGHLLTTLVIAQLLRSAPELAGMSGSGGAPALQSASVVHTAAAPGPAANPGDLALRFSFDPPPPDARR